ncbi:MAG: sulfite exporter TauE/SafE family protein [SAR202 cluster bacterium]|nr:sulfite exporter TauE/SafE family protein [SAR202 cluster bacterium]
MFFPNAGVDVNPFLLLLLGLITGVLGGFFGIGGGFLITGGLLVFGLSPIFAVGTSLALVLGSSVVSMLRHRRAGNLDFKLGLLLVTGTVPALLVAQWLAVRLEESGSAGPVIRYAYVVFLAALGVFIIHDSWRNRHRVKAGEDTVSTAALIRRVQALRIPPHSIKVPGVGTVRTYVALPKSGIESVSVFVPMGMGVLVGFMAGLLGAGGGFIVVPALIFLMGVPTEVAISVSLFQTTIAASMGTFLYSLSNHVDLLMAVIMLTAASIGSRLGVAAIRVVIPSRVRLLYGLTLLGGALAVGLKQVSSADPGLGYLASIAAVVLLSASGAICVLLVALVFLAMRKRLGPAP